MKKIQDIKVNGYHCEITENEKVNCQKKAFDASGGEGGGTEPDTPGPVTPEEPEKDITQQIEEKAIEGELASIDPDNNLRYVGSNPNNYVNIGKTDGTKELWRIIGVFDGQMKIIRNNFYGTYIAWDTNKKNNWSKATLKTELNGTFLNTIDTTYKTYIDENHVWKLGGCNTIAITREAVYNAERGTDVYSGNSTTWTGAVAVMYTSDYAYASSGENSTCGSNNLNSWHNYSDCYGHDWLYGFGDFSWTLTHLNGTSYFAIYVTSSGKIDNYYNVAREFKVRPVVYLNSNVKITGGSGTSSEPFEIGV